MGSISAARQGRVCEVQSAHSQAWRATACPLDIHVCACCCCASGRWLTHLQRHPPAVELGQYGIVPNYFEQNQAQALDPRLTVLETLVRCGGR